MTSHDEVVRGVYYHHVDLDGSTSSTRLIPSMIVVQPYTIRRAVTPLKNDVRVIPILTTRTAHITQPSQPSPIAHPLRNIGNTNSIIASIELYPRSLLTRAFFLVDGQIRVRTGGYVWSMFPV